MLLLYTPTLFFFVRVPHWSRSAAFATSKRRFDVSVGAIESATSDECMVGVIIGGPRTSRRGHRARHGSDKRASGHVFIYVCNSGYSLVGHTIRK